MGRMVAMQTTRHDAAEVRRLLEVRVGIHAKSERRVGVSKLALDPFDRLPPARA